MEVCCGTMKTETFDIIMEDYASRKDNDATTIERNWAFREFSSLLNQGTDFINDHHRNHDAVNGCICLHVLGYDPKEWFDNFFHMDEVEKAGRFFGCDVNKFMEHVKRVCPYLESWGPVGNEGNALNYLI